MVLILLGPPGVGKGTQAVRLAEELQGIHVSTGDLLRAARRDGTELGQRAQKYMDAGELVPDGLILDLVREHLTDVPPGAPVLFDGFPRTTAQAEGLDQVLEQSGRRVDLVVLFTAPDETIVKRLGGRRSCPQCGAVYNVHFNPPAVEGRCDRCGSPLQQRPDDVPATISRRLEVYRDQTAPLVSFYEKAGVAFERIVADRGVDEVYADFRASLEVAP
ncbi:MAG: adenylate kinase [Gemmatimonadales bacterium]